MLRAVRGAITVERDGAEEVLDATEEMLCRVVELNGIEEDAVVSVLFTVTPDLTSTFPAAAARKIGWTETPLMCAGEIPVPGALPRCIRLLLHFHTELAKDEIRHVYMKEARSLRPDLVQEEESK
ncbi:MAG: chorismate mutase [Clostridia bacterium]